MEECCLLQAYEPAMTSCSTCAERDPCVLLTGLMDDEKFSVGFWGPNFDEEYGSEDDFSDDEEEEEEEEEDDYDKCADEEDVSNGEDVMVDGEDEDEEDEDENEEEEEEHDDADDDSDSEGKGEDERKNNGPQIWSSLRGWSHVQNSGGNKDGGGRGGGGRGDDEEAWSEDEEDEDKEVDEHQERGFYVMCSLGGSRWVPRSALFDDEEDAS